MNSYQPLLNHYASLLCGVCRYGTLKRTTPLRRTASSLRLLARDKPDNLFKCQMNRINSLKSCRAQRGRPYKTCGEPHVRDEQSAYGVVRVQKENIEKQSEIKFIPLNKRQAVLGVALISCNVIPGYLWLDSKINVSVHGEYAVAGFHEHLRILLDANDFELVVPSNFVDLGVPEVKKPTFSATPGAPPPPSPIKARYTSPDDTATITVVVREASSIKPTFVQIEEITCCQAVVPLEECLRRVQIPRPNREASGVSMYFNELQDISSWGNGVEVAQLLLPRTLRIRGFQKIVIERPPKDTRTIAGVVQVPPLTIYRYEADSGNGQQVRIAAAALKGKVYLCAGQCTQSATSSTLDTIEKIIDSFRCKEEFKPLY